MKRVQSKKRVAKRFAKRERVCSHRVLKRRWDVRFEERDVVHHHAFYVAAPSEAFDSREPVEPGFFDAWLRKRRRETFARVVSGVSVFRDVTCVT